MNRYCRKLEMLLIGYFITYLLKKMAIKGKLLFWLLLPDIIIAIPATVICFFTIQKTVKQNITNQLLRADVELGEDASVSSEKEKSYTLNVQPETNISGNFASHVSLRDFFILMGIAVGTAVLVGIKVSKKIFISLKLITEGTKRIAGGDFETPLSIDMMESDMRELGESFNSMMNKLRETEEKNRELFLQVKSGRGPLIQ
ncbi:MAG: HAMP domain-containing protein [Candidatus Scalindua sp.]|nr:HAMP domain-containing protein [Candidatus Scalindua sp.]